MKGNVLIVHGGGPTAVINHSLYGVLSELYQQNSSYKIYAAKNGTGGVLTEDLIDLSNLKEAQIERLKQTPGSAIGSSRDPLNDKDYAQLLQIVKKHQIKYVLFNGGNGTMDTCGKFHEICKKFNEEIYVIGIPKTMDNDLAITDHSPGFGSAARYIAQSIREVSADLKGLPIHVVIVETSGRNAGWIAAASALAGVNNDLGPDLIYVPEVPFSEEKFLEDVSKCLEHKKGVLVVASEGLVNENQESIVKPVFEVGRAKYFGDISSHLANLIIQKLGYKARGEKPGLLGRSSIALLSQVDAYEAEQVGRLAVRAVLKEETGKMVALKRKEGKDYDIEYNLVDINEVMLYEKKLPAKYISESKNGVTDEFIEWCLPLIGDSLPEMISFN